MTFAQIASLLLTVVALSSGQILFKMASQKLPPSLDLDSMLSLLSLELISALVIYFFATIAWIYAIKDIELRVAYPFVSLGFILVPLLAHFLLGESISIRTFIGAGLIVVGLIISVT